MSDKYKKSEFTGIEVNPSCYPKEIKPFNVSFIECNILERVGIPFDDDYFDFVHVRFMIFSFTLKEWEIVIPEIIRVCKPEGWIEIVEGLYFVNLKQFKFKTFK